MNLTRLGTEKNYWKSSNGTASFHKSGFRVDSGDLQVQKLQLGLPTIWHLVLSYCRAVYLYPCPPRTRSPIAEIFYKLEQLHLLLSDRLARFRRKRAVFLLSEFALLL